MSIPGYDPDDVDEFVLERAGARVAVVAGVVPDAFGLDTSAGDPPADALSKPVSIVGLDGLKAVEALRLSLAYDPTALPPGASPTDVAVAVEGEGGRELLYSEVDLEETIVTATLAERPPGDTIVAVSDVDDEAPAGSADGVGSDESRTE